MCFTLIMRLLNNRKTAICVKIIRKLSNRRHTLCELNTKNKRMDSGSSMSFYTSVPQTKWWVFLICRPINSLLALGAIIMQMTLL